jgi:SAM-dependent methyltransferase
VANINKFRPTAAERLMRSYCVSSKSLAPMNVNHRYVLDFARRFAAESHNAGLKILDYGCGGGAVVGKGLEEGLDISGADLFQEHASDRSTASQSGLLGSRIFEIREGRLPWPAEHFDLVVSNQVFEHVADLGAVVREIHRVLKPDGTLLAVLPHSRMIFEVHSRLPFVHWFPPQSRVRFWWSLAMCWCLNRNDKGRSPREWTQHSLAWLDEFCFYKTPRGIDRVLASGFDVHHIEQEYAAFRRQYSRLWRIATPFSGTLGRINGPISRTLGGLVFVASKKTVAKPYSVDARNSTSSIARTSLSDPKSGDFPEGHTPER